MNGCVSRLCRMEPFSSVGLLIHNGKKDSRILSNFTDGFKVLETLSPTELVPEFYYLPEYLIDVNCQDFGFNQIGKDKYY